MAARPQVNAIAVFYKNGLIIHIGGRDQAGIAAEIDVADSASAAENEIHGPPALVMQLNAGDIKLLHIGKEDQIVDTDIRAAIFSGVFLVKSIVCTAIQDRLANAHNADVTVSACQGSAFGGSAMLVGE